MKSLVVLTTLVAIAVFGFQIWNGPSLDQRLRDAASAGDARSFAWLVWLGADVGLRKQGYSPSPIQDAAYKGDLRAVQLFVQHGAYLDYTEKDGFSPISYAALEEHWEIVEFLYRSGANPNLVDASGHTALNYAEVAGQDALVQLMTNNDDH